LHRLRRQIHTEGTSQTVLNVLCEEHMALWSYMVRSSTEGSGGRCVLSS
jgi:hypothetical protein